MLRPTPLLLSLIPGLALAIAPTLQRGGEKEQEPGQAVDIFGRPSKQGVADTLELMQGAWQLFAVDDPALPPDGRRFRGFMLVTGSFLALEMHFQWEDTKLYDGADVFQSGVHEFVFDRPGRIRTTTLIGAFMDEEDDDALELEWESPGFGRLFQVQVASDRLSLTRSDGSRMEFVRRVAGRSAVRDIYGRMKFGGEEVDIYGRRQPPKPLDDKDDGQDDD